jgi:hypothetical protein
MNRGNFFSELKRRNIISTARLSLVSFCPKISEDRYQSRRGMRLVTTTPVPPGEP